MDKTFIDWVQSSLSQLDYAPAQGSRFELQALSGDAGFRRYFRLNAHEALLAVNAPPATEDSRAFVKIAAFLHAQNVRTPRIIAQDIAQGFLIVEDLGEHLLLEQLNNDSVDTLYSHALMLLLRMQQSPLDYSVFPLYDKNKLREELHLFSEWFVQKQLGICLNEKDRQLIDNTFDLIEDSALAQTQVLVHRDFHSRNLVYADDGNFGVIDFQDAVIGPLTYDLVSLLKDCYIEWPEDKVERWMLAFASTAVEVGVLPPVSESQFRSWFELMGLQRHLKVLGIFCRLSLRDNKHGYLNDLPLVVRYVRKTLGRQAALSEFSDWFETALMPHIRQQDWMK